MVEYDLLISKIFEYLNVLFPNFKTCRDYYYDPDIDSKDLATKLVAMSSKRFKYKIESFDFEKYINTTNHSALFEFISSFLPEKYQKTGILIFNTLAKRILFNVHNNEEKFKNDSELFLKMIKNEVDEFILLIHQFAETNSYLFYTNDISITEDLQGKYLIDNITFHSMNENLVLIMEKIDFNIRNYRKKERLLINALSLIFTKKIKFYQFADTHTMRLENYGCKNIILYPINDEPWHTVKYNIPFIPFDAKIKLNSENFVKIQSLLVKYMDILENLEKDDYKKVSLDFYLDAIEKFDAAKITYSIIAIEALFNVSHSDIQKTLVQRGLKILQNYYEQEYWEKIECDLKTAYDIRSDYAHGERRSSKKADIKLAERILEYARIILTVFIQLSTLVKEEKGKIGEKKYINNYLIEKSLLYPDINTKFCQMLKSLQVNIKPFDDIGSYYDTFLKTNIKIDNNTNN